MTGCGKAKEHEGTIKRCGDAFFKQPWYCEECIALKDEPINSNGDKGEEV